MKKLLLLLLIPGILFSVEFTITESDNFILKSEKKSGLDQILSEAENLNTQLNTVLRLNQGDNKREITLFENRESYNSYLKELEIPERDDYIYIKFSDNREKVIIFNDEKLNIASLRHHLTLQYMDFYGNGAPQWLSLGIAAYFEDPSNNSGLDIVKNSPESNRIMSCLKNDPISDLTPYYSRILVYYLLESSNKEDNRLFWDTLSYLKYSRDSGKSDRISSNFNEVKLNSAIYDYLQSKKSYDDYMKDGISLYNSKEFRKAADSFTEALKIKKDSYSPEYYLGLTLSEAGKYQEANSHFTLALDKGAPKDITYYSIGVNFFKTKEFKQAENYLHRIEDEKYRQMAQTVLDEIRKY